MPTSTGNACYLLPLNPPYQGVGWSPRLGAFPLLDKEWLGAVDITKRSVIPAM